MDNKDRSAFPSESKLPGLSKLEYISAIALQGLLSNPSYDAKENPRVYASDAIKFAVALLEELENK